MIAIILKDSSKTWYSKHIGEAIEVEHCKNNDKYLIHKRKSEKPGAKFPVKKYLIMNDCELLPL